jgi:hypothetical protein
MTRKFRRKSMEIMPQKNKTRLHPISKTDREERARRAIQTARLLKMQGQVLTPEERKVILRTMVKMAREKVIRESMEKSPKTVLTVGGVTRTPGATLKVLKDHTVTTIEMTPRTNLANLSRRVVEVPTMPSRTPVTQTLMALAMLRMERTLTPPEQRALMVLAAKE